jgi:hypothetical protein
MALVEYDRKAYIADAHKLEQEEVAKCLGLQR